MPAAPWPWTSLLMPSLFPSYFPLFFCQSSAGFSPVIIRLSQFHPCCCVEPQGTAVYLGQESDVVALLMRVRLGFVTHKLHTSSAAVLSRCLPCCKGTTAGLLHTLSTPWAGCWCPGAREEDAWSVTDAGQACLPQPLLRSGVLPSSWPETVSFPIRNQGLRLL